MMLDELTGLEGSSVYGTQTVIKHHASPSECDVGFVGFIHSIKLAILL